MSKMNQFSLDGYLPPHQFGSATSLAAAKSIVKKIGPMHKKILEYLGNNPAGASDEQMSNELSMAGNTLRPRRRELEQLGRIKDSGMTGPTKSGRAAMLWVLV